MKVRSLIVLISISFSLSLALLPANSLTAQVDMPKYGEDSVTCVENLSLYRESYKQWRQSKYKSPAIDHAIKYWYYVFEECPLASENIYVDGIKMIEYYIKKAKTDTERESLIDTMMAIYDKRIKYFPNYYKPPHYSQVGSILGRKGVDLYQLRPSAYLEAYEILKQSLELDGQEASGPVFVYYFRCVTKMAMKGDTDTAAVVDAYDLVGGYVEANIKKYREEGDEKKENEYINIMGNIENTFEPFALCPDLVRIYQQKYDKAPDDINLLKKIVDILDKKKCVEDPLFFDATVSLYELEPTSESAYLIGKMYLMQERYKEAIPYMEAATEMEDTDKVGDAYIFLAQAYRSLDNFPKAREMALAAAAQKPSWGEPYMFIGDLYALSAKSCGNDDLTKKVAYWAAVDKYIKAKSVAPELTEAANKRINIYKAYFPPTETLFFYNLNVGDKYTVECWINEVTTIRASN
jgi:tetratricopeptide (TPR) repeat protein